MTEQSLVELNTLQLAIINTSTRHPDYTYRQIAEDCGCSTSTVGRTIRNNQIPKRNRPPVESISEVTTHERLRRHATMDALACAGKLSHKINRSQKTRDESLTKIKNKHETAKEKVADNLKDELTREHSLEEISEIIKKRSTVYPANELLDDIFDIDTGEKERPSVAEFKPLCDILSELKNRCMTLADVEALSQDRERQYASAARCYQNHHEIINGEIKERENLIIDPVPPDEIRSEIKAEIRQNTVEAARIIKSMLESGIPIEPIVDEYRIISNRVNPRKFINRWNLHTPLYPPPEVNLRMLRHELESAPSFAR